MTLHPAIAETYVVEVNPQSSEGFIRIPVLAWTMEDGRPLPVTLNGKHTLIGGDSAVMFPGGMVEHPSDGLAFDSVEAWLESNPGKPKKNPPAPKQTKPTAAQERDEDAMGEGVYDIEWTDKTYKSNSFWHYDDGEYEFVFVVEGETPYPKATEKCVKIKRDEFMSMKKNVDALTVEDIQNADPLPVAEEDEDEDDGMDLL